MDFAELGQGFHMVPVRDHCRVRVPRRVRLTQAAADRLFLEADREIDGYRVKCTEHALACLSRRNDNAMKLARRKRECALAVVDPMAVQASRILSAVLSDLRNDI